MTLRSILFAGGWVVGLIVAFMLGKATCPRAEVQELVALDQEHAIVATPPLTSPVQATALPGKVAPGGAFEHSVLELETSEAFRSLFKEMLTGFEDARTHDDLFLLADAWGAAAPEEACVWLDELDFNDVRNPYLFSALTQWARKDPDAARLWVEARYAMRGPTRDYLLASLVRGMARRDPDSALQVLLAAPASPERTGAIDFLLEAWRQTDLEHAFGQVATLPASETRLKERAVSQLVAGLAPSELALSRAWAAALSSPEDRRIAQVGIAANWSRRDPVAAAEWVSSLDDTVTRSRAYGAVAIRWARVDPLGASRWLGRYADRPEYDFACRAVAWSTVGIDPDIAFKQVAAITSVPLRDETFEQVGRIWLSEQPQEARLFLEGESSIPPAIRERLLDSFE